MSSRTPVIHENHPASASGRLIIVDSKKMHAGMLCDAFQQKSPDFDVRTATCIASALAFFSEGMPNAILLSEYPHYFIHDAVHEIYAKDANIRIILLDKHPCPCGLFLATMMHGYWTRRDSHEEMVREVGNVLNGCTSISPEAEILVNHPEAPTFGLDRLSKKEFQCFVHLTWHRDIRRCADELRICPKTVINHKTHIMKKWNVHAFDDLAYLVHPIAVAD